MTNLLAKLSTWKLIIPALLGSIYCIYLFQNAQAALTELAGEPTEIIDMKRNYTAPEITEFFTKIKSEGREIHKHTTGVVDMVFPITYGLLFILLSAFLLKKITSPDSKWMYLALIPVALMIVDYIENFNTLNLLDSYPDLSAEMVDSASAITGIKEVLTNISFSLPIVLGIIWLGKWIKNRLS